MRMLTKHKEKGMLAYGFNTGGKTMNCNQIAMMMRSPNFGPSEQGHVDHHLATCTETMCNARAYHAGSGGLLELVGRGSDATVRTVKVPKLKLVKSQPVDDIPPGDHWIHRSSASI